jgi:putative tricarboxylic transport membrane protein
MENVHKSDIVPTVLLILFSTILYWVIIPDQIHVPSQVKSEFLSPAFSTKVFALFLGLMSLILLLNTIFHIRKYSPTDLGKADAKPRSKKSLIKEEGLVAAILIICCIVVVSIEYLGMVIPSIFFLGAMMVYFGQRRWVVIIGIMILVPLVLYFFFHDLAKVSLPKGALFSLERFL